MTWFIIVVTVPFQHLRWRRERRHHDWSPLQTESPPIWATQTSWEAHVPSPEIAHACARAHTHTHTHLSHGEEELRQGWLWLRTLPWHQWGFLLHQVESRKGPDAPGGRERRKARPGKCLPPDGFLQVSEALEKGAPTARVVKLATSCKKSHSMPERKQAKNSWKSATGPMRNLNLILFYLSFAASTALGQVNF